MITETDTCRKYVLPELIQAGWDNDPHSFTEQKTFTDGRIVVAGDKTRRRPQKRAEYGTAQFVIPDVLKVPPISDRGNVIEIAA